MVSETGISAAGRGLLSFPCPDCQAREGQYCTGNRNISRQHTGRYDAWRAAGRPVIAPDGTVVTDSGRVTPA